MGKVIDINRSHVAAHPAPYVAAAECWLLAAFCGALSVALVTHILAQLMRYPAGTK